MVLVVGAATLDSQEATSRPQPPSNSRMAARLEAVALEAELGNSSSSSRRLEVLLSITPANTFHQQVTYRLLVAEEMVRAGRTEQARVDLEQLLAFLQADDIDFPREFREFLDTLILSTRHTLGKTLLRLAQLSNCLPPNLAARCVVPTDTTAIHPNQDYAHRAIEVYEQVLASDPANLSARWLLNLAYIVDGRAPERRTLRVAHPPVGLRLEFGLYPVRGRRAKTGR